MYDDQKIKTFNFSMVVFTFLCQFEITARHSLTLDKPFVPVLRLWYYTKVVSSNPTHGEVYSIQHYVIKFVSDL